MAQNDRNTRIAQKAFEMVDKVYGKSQKITPPPHVPRDEFPSRYSQNSYEYGGPKTYTIKEAISTTTRRRVIYHQYSNGSTIKEPVVPHPTERIQYFGGATARPFIGYANRFERPKGRAISCDEAVQLYGGVLIKEFRKPTHMLKLVVKAFT
ncbi:hypothetical protein HID58_012183 [Brassica napus]|uniref:Uncharacterized protein n=3 Tax=Brassica TaxID=3705 RepID=A0A3P6A6M8_BRACM|nr:hypothetical protein HID58_012183 [Brassica napus]CAF2129965.1 unnamed protein product [Brassica napus]CAG7883654.1 unnamed protein product [Brassica rapa]VDC82833.1 unnamed protein product [Brassica rapa]